MTFVKSLIRGLAWPLLVGTVLFAMPGTTPAAVTPVTLIDRQVIKPNMLILLDVSTSMIFAPGNREQDSAEVGQDCDNGDDSCRTIGAPGRCYYAATGAAGAGIRADRTSCHNDTECRTGWCKNSIAQQCDQNSDCTSSNGPCKGFCSNDNSKSCTSDSDAVSKCGSTAKCRGYCSTGGTRCTTDAQCPGSWCMAYTNDFCVLPTDTTKQSKVKMCQIGQNLCYSNADCTANVGDTCGPATSRMTIAKRVISNVVSSYASTVNFGLMTFWQDGYYTYYKVNGGSTDKVIDRYLEKDELKALGCWTKQNGVSPTCVIAGVTYNRRNNPDSRYRVRTGGDSFVMVDSNWCGVWCTLTQGTGFYEGSYFTFTEKQSAVDEAATVKKTSYLGKSIKEGTVDYIYWETPTTQRNVNGVNGDEGTNKGINSPNAPDPITNGSGSTCNATNGGMWNTEVAPFMDTTNNAAAATAMITKILARTEKSQYGGYAAHNYTPTGCMLWNDTTTGTKNTSAYHYMTDVKAADTMPCRSNYVMLVTDGAPNHAKDTNCDDAACSTADLAGCTCHSVIAAKKFKDAGMKVYVIGFSSSVNNAEAVASMNNVAKAGGSTSAYFAVGEQKLKEAMVYAIYDAARGSYSTAPASAASGVQQAGGNISLSSMLLDTRVDFPGWRGQLVAYDTAVNPPAVLWNAATVAFDYNVNTGKYFTSTTPVDRTGDWKKRNVWTSNGTTMVKFDVNQTTGAINNKSTLKTLGLGATDDEAERVARWLLGDPALKNPAVLGAILNSTPIDVGPAGKSSLPGGEAFYQAQLNRPFLTYAGASDGMLHAFYTKDISTWNYKAGQEAFAYIPQTMLAVTLKLYAQGGQLPDPKDHVYGLANSPKVKSMCVSNCTDASTAVWKTQLVMTYGWGGTEAFMVDVTSPFTSSGIKSSTTTPPAPLVWSTQYMNSSQTSAYDNALGLTTSVPAFYYAKGATRDDFRIVFGSYGTDASTGQVSKVLLNSSAKTGVITDSKTINPGNNCTQLFGLMSDVATARNHAVTEETQIAAAYFGDTWGNLYRYVPGIGSNLYTGQTGSYTTVEAMTCNHPVHYAPLIVQLDRENATNRPGEIYVVQVTNSALDLVTKDYPASKVVFRRDKLDTATGAITADSTFGTSGKIELTAGVAGQMCGETTADGSSCVVTLPAGARPNATPMGILRADGTGFQAIATWYVPAVDGCNEGTTYLTVHEFSTTTGLVKQRFAMKLASEPVTSAVFVGGKLYFARQGSITDLTGSLPSTLKFSSQVTGERFRRTGWSERP